MNARDIPAAIHWHEGLLLTPQHFQQLTSRHEALVQYSAGVYSPFCWGLLRLKHQSSTLHTGKLQVLDLEAVMPDGLLVSHSGGDPLEADLTEFKTTMMKRSVPIYLAVMAGDGAMNGNSDRYEQFDGGLNADPVSNGKSREIFRVRPKLKLMAVPDSLPAKYVGFPVAKVNYTDSYRFDEEFIPPLLSVPASSADAERAVSGARQLASLCAEIAQTIRDRATILLNEEARGANRFHSLPDGDAGRLEQLIKAQGMLSTIGVLPVLEAMLQSGGLHPLSVYLGLCSVAGHLAALRTEMIPDAFKPYNHNDLYATFKELIDFIERTLDEGVPVSYESFHFHFEDHSFQLRFEGAWMDKQLALAIHGPREMSEETLKRWGETSLIASEDKIQEIRKNRTTGVPRLYAERIGDITPKKGVVLFSLPDTKQIDPNQMLHILNDGTWPRDIVLHVFKD